MRRTATQPVLLLATLFLIPSAAGISITVHSPEPGKYYSGSALLNFSVSERANVTKRYDTGVNGTVLVDTTGQTKRIYGEGWHVLFLNAVSFDNASERDRVMVPFRIGRADAGLSTAGTGRQTAVTGCADLISPGQYELTTDIRASIGGFASCMFIDADTITLDCNNHVISGNDGFGVEFRSALLTVFDDVIRTVKNCRIQGFRSGFRMSNTRFMNITENVVRRSTEAALRVNGVNSLFMTENRFINNRATFYGFRLGVFSNGAVDPNLIINNLFQDRTFIHPLFTPGNVISSHNRWSVQPRPGNRVTGTGLVGGNVWSNPSGTGFSNTCTDSDGNGFCDRHFNVLQQQPTTATGSFIDEYPIALGPTAPPEIKRFSISPSPPKTGENVTVSVSVEHADNVTVQTQVNGELTNHTATSPASGDTWKITLPPRNEPGTRVVLTLFARNPVGTDVLRGDGPFIKIQDRLMYYVFEEVKQVAVLLGRFEGEDPFGPDTVFNAPQQIQGWEVAREVDINKFYGSRNGSMGRWGFNLTYFDNNGQFYEVKQRKAYDPDNPDSGHDEFANDLEQAAADDMNPGRFDFNITTHSGLEIATPRQFGDNIYVPMEQVEFENQTFEAFGIWFHELGHTLGLEDLYEKGNIDFNIALMGGDGDKVPFGSSQPPAPFTVTSRTEFNSLAPEWMETNETQLETIPLLTGKITTVDALKSLTLDDEVEVIDASDSVTFPLRLDFAFEGRPFVPPKRALIYRVDNEGEDINVLTDFGPGLRRTGDSITEKLGVLNPAYVTFTLESEQGTGEQYEAVVNTRPEPKLLDATVATMQDQTAQIDFDTLGTTKPPGVTAPNLDLRAIDQQGRLIGTNRTTGTFVNQIPGAVYSGDRIGSIEWIAVPDNVSVQFFISSHDIQRFINKTNRTKGLLENQFRLSVTDYGPDAQIVRENGTLTVNDTAVAFTSGSIGPGEQQAGILPADIDFEPDTVNLNSQSRWVTTYIELPEGFNVIEENGGNTTAINISTVTLNGEVDAVDDEQLGFVKDSELKDRDDDGVPELMVKFPGDRVRDVLRTGDQQRITITGRTVDNRLISGIDHVRVIDRGNKGQGPLNNTQGPPPGIAGHVSTAVNSAITAVINSAEELSATALPTAEQKSYRTATTYSPTKTVRCSVLSRVTWDAGCRPVMVDLLMVVGGFLLVVGGRYYRRQRDRRIVVAAAVLAIIVSFPPVFHVTTHETTGEFRCLFDGISMNATFSDRTVTATIVSTGKNAVENVSVSLMKDSQPVGTQYGKYLYLGSLPPNTSQSITLTATNRFPDSIRAQTPCPDVFAVVTR